MDTAAPLGDLLVLDLTIARAGPTAVRHLADWGARVLRIEPSDPTVGLLGDHDNSDYINLHRSKQLIQLDLRDADDRRRFFQLVEHADVLVENNRPPVKSKLGIDYEACAAVNPRLIYGSISGYGQEGPASGEGRRRPGHPGCRRPHEHHRAAGPGTRFGPGSPCRTPQPGISWRSESSSPSTSGHAPGSASGCASPSSRR